MTLTSGTRIGSYEILAAIGAGGMGEVYRARDAKLGRDVALKVLPEAFARDAERMARFQREAKLLASLNHPNIAAIYGVEESGTTHALVMELVEGPTLAERISGSAARTSPTPAGLPGPSATGTQSARKPSGTQAETGRAIPVDEALRIAKQICEALEYAHERGIVHRDLKPANIKVSRDDAVKVLDFGLAKAIEGDASSMDMANSPTISGLATQAGVILGTAAYMSPEQAKGRPVDRRTDIWAFGCVLFEMLTGKLAFSGETVTDTLAAVIRAEPDWTLLPRNTPLRVRVLLQRCLQKDSKQRLQAIGDARISLDEVLSGAPELLAEATGGARRGNRWTSAVGWGIAAAAVATAIFLAIRGPAPPRSPWRKFEISVGNLSMSNAGSGYPQISPDGRMIAYLSDGGLFVRHLNQLEPQKLVDFQQIHVMSVVFWSPDSRFVGYEEEGKLWRIPTAGGSTAEICTLPGPILSAAWGAGDEIFFSSWRGDMYEVSGQGGDAKALGLHDPKIDVDFHDLTFLPGGQDLLYTTHLVGGRSRLEVLSHGKPKVIFNEKDWSVWAPAYSSIGDLLFMRGQGSQDSIWAIPFSAAKRAVTGQPYLVTGQGIFPSVSSGETLEYVLPPPPGRGQLVWVARDGIVLGTIGQPQRGLANPVLSPDGKRIAAVGFEENSDGNLISNIWVYDAASGARSPLLSRASQTSQEYFGPSWTPDGSRIVFTVLNGIKTSIALVNSDGSSGMKVLWSGSEPQISTRGNYLSYTINKQNGTDQACFAPLAGRGLPQVGAEPTCLPRATAHNRDLVISPDERYGAFVGGASGNVYVTEFPSGHGLWQASVGGGRFPLWDGPGDTLYYLGNDGEMMEVKLKPGPPISLSSPVKLFSTDNQHLTLPPVAGAAFDVSSDGQRFLMVQQVGVPPAPAIVVDQNWSAEFANNKQN
ncbi:MAG: protein kinase domain-containing protein [Candidatus Acidiferrales bacterium]